MTRHFRMTYLSSIIDRYRKASKALKSKILDELCKVCHYHRKYAIARLAALRDGQAPSRPVTHKRKKRYVRVFCELSRAFGKQRIGPGPYASK